MDWTSLQANTPWIASVGWTLIQSIWQLALIAIIYGMIKFVIRQLSNSSNPRLLYFAGCAAMAAMIALPLITLGLMLKHESQKSASVSSSWLDQHVLVDSQSPTQVSKLDSSALNDTEAGIDSASAFANAFGAELPQAQAESSLPSSGYLLFVVLAWSIGVCLFSVRPIAGMIHVRALCKRDNQPIAKTWQRTTTRIAERLKIKKVFQVVESACVQVPTVVGYFKPIVLVPAAALTGLSQQQMTLILAHELAHIRRHDFLINFAQTVVETLLFYHPAVWWLSREVRNERENCCDDIAVQLEGDPTSLAHALLALEESRLAAPALAATGGSLSARIKRLMNIHPTKQAPFVGLATLALAGLVFSVAISPAFASPQQSQTPEHVDESAVITRDADTTPVQEPTFEKQSENAVEKKEKSRTDQSKVTKEPYVQVLAIYTKDREAAETYHQLVLENPTREYFQKLSAEVSEDPHIRQLEGGVPPVRRGIGLPEIEEAAFNLRYGGISKVTKAKEGWMILYSLGAIYPDPADAPRQDDQVIVKTYLIADLIASPFPFVTNPKQKKKEEIDAQPLIELIQSTIEPDSWVNHRIAFLEEGLCLIVSHKRSVHDQVEDLFEKLRELNEVIIETRGFLISLPHDELQRFRLFPEGWGEEPTALGIRDAATLNAIAVAKDSVELQNLPTEILFNGQTFKTGISLLEELDETQLVLRQVVSPERDSIRNQLIVSGDNLLNNEPKVFDSKNGQMLAVDLTKLLELDPKQRRVILVLKSNISQDVE